MTNLNMTFYVMVSVILSISLNETCPSSLRNSEMANSASVLRIAFVFPLSTLLTSINYTSKKSSQGVSQVHPLLNSTRLSVNHVFCNVDLRKNVWIC